MREASIDVDASEEGDELFTAEIPVWSDVQKVGGPLERVSVEAVCVRLPALGPPAIGLSDLIDPCEGTPIERSADVVAAPVEVAGQWDGR